MNLPTRISRAIWSGLVCAWLACLGTPAMAQTAEAFPATSADDAAPGLDLALKSPSQKLWQNGVGNGFSSSLRSLSLESGASVGFAALGGRLRHDLVLVSLSYGHMLGPVRGEGHWYRGNWEWRGELFTGAEFSPGTVWGVGLTPHLRYNFATGTRWVPFADIGAGVTATGERGPDLGGAFEFNLQGAVGAHWFVRNNWAVTVEARYVHVSSAGLYTPNLGLNTVAGMIGVTWFF